MKEIKKNIDDYRFKLIEYNRAELELEEVRKSLLKNIEEEIAEIEDYDEWFISCSYDHDGMPDGIYIKCKYVPNELLSMLYSYGFSMGMESIDSYGKRVIVILLQ